MNRNIVTIRDAEAARAVLHEQVREAARREGIVAERKLGDTDGVPRPTVEPPKPDTWYERLAKYIPAEALSLYLALDRAVQSSIGTAQPEKNPDTKPLIVWLAVALALSLLFNVLYLKRIWKIKRASQIVVSSVALLIYVYVSGGVFKAANLAPPVLQLMLLIATAAFLAFFDPPERATAPQQGQISPEKTED